MKRVSILKKADKNEEFRLQRERLTNFAHDLHLKLRMLLGEMEGDLMVLRERKLDKNVWKIFAKLWSDLIEIAKSIDPNDPYTAGNKLVSYVKNRPYRAIIENLEFLIKNHLKNTEVEFTPTSFFQPLQVRSLKLLQELANQIEKYMQENPMIQVPELSAEEKATLLQGPEDFKPVGEEVSTKLHGKRKS